MGRNKIRVSGIQNDEPLIEPVAPYAIIVVVLFPHPPPHADFSWGASSSFFIRQSSSIRFAIFWTGLRRISTVEITYPSVTSPDLWFRSFFEQVGWNPHLRRDRGKSPSEIMNGEIYSEFIDHPKPGIIDIPDPDGEVLSQKNMNGFSVSVFRSLRPNFQPIKIEKRLQ